MAITKKTILCVIFITYLSDGILPGQESDDNVFYRVYFKDKGENSINDFLPSDLLSVRAVERRQKSGIPAPDYKDLPVSNEYVRKISLPGFYLHSKSKWMNCALFKVSRTAADTYAFTDTLLKMPFVKNVKLVKHAFPKSLHTDKLSVRAEQPYLTLYDRPVTMLNGRSIHNSGFDGKGIVIAIFDGGFLNADLITSLNDLRNRKGIKGTYDFVKNDAFVYDYHNHGTAVLSILSGKMPGQIEGTAPGADYWLLRTEDHETEYPVEEDFWVSAAEFADSVGADIISSSLGYFCFDDPEFNYKFSDMDGDKTFITRAADIAASKGILVINSAGNERNEEWLRIVAPSDADSVVAVGAVDVNKVIAAFSSAGPSYDDRIKPDVVAQGVSVPLQISPANFNRADGTSFSCPLISGMCACIMQAVPKATAPDIISALRYSSDRYYFPDSLYGYGIPDMEKMLRFLQDKLVRYPENSSIISPNPFTNEINIIFKSCPEKLRIEIFSSSGRMIIRKDYKNYISRYLNLNELRDTGPGLYIIRLITEKGIFTHKVIKVSNQK